MIGESHHTPNVHFILLFVRDCFVFLMVRPEVLSSRVLVPWISFMVKMRVVLSSLASSLKLKPIFLLFQMQNKRERMRAYVSCDTWKSAHFYHLLMNVSILAPFPMFAAVIAGNEHCHWLIAG